MESSRQHVTGEEEVLQAVQTWTTHVDAVLAGDKSMSLERLVKKAVKRRIKSEKEVDVKDSVKEEWKRQLGSLLLRNMLDGFKYKDNKGKVKRKGAKRSTIKASDHDGHRDGDLITRNKKHRVEGCIDTGSPGVSAQQNPHNDLVGGDTNTNKDVGIPHEGQQMGQVAAAPTPGAQKAVIQDAGIDRTAQRRSKHVDETANDCSWRESDKRKDIKTGLYSKEEEATIREAVRQFAIDRGLSTEDYSWVIGVGRGQRSKETVGIWSTVAKSLPQRSIKSVAAAGVRLFHPFANKGPWTVDDDLALKALVEAKGTKWTSIAAAIERTPEACRFRWREIKLGEKKCVGTWSAEEEQRLKDAIEKFGNPRSLSGQSNRNKKPDRRLLLDDINWEAVVAHVGTRSRLQCIGKWYSRLAPSMIERGDWGIGDDRRMLKSLSSLGNCEEHEVPWNDLVKERTADQCKRRWRLMLKTVPKAKDKEFYDIVQHLVEKHLKPKQSGSQSQTKPTSST